MVLNLGYCRLRPTESRQKQITGSAISTTQQYRRSQTVNAKE
ncbi:hypothetical protein [Nostoc sp. CCY 9925]